MDVEVSDADAVAPRDRRNRREVPGVGVERIGKERLEIGGRRSAPRVDGAHALPAIVLNLVTMKELRSDLQVVASSCVVRVGEIVTYVPDPLILVPRIELVAGNREVREGDARRPRGDAARRLPVLRPRREVGVGEAEHGPPRFHFVQRPIAQHLRELPEELVVVLVVGAGCRRVALVAGSERLGQLAVGILAHHPHLRRQLVVETHAALLLVVDAGQLHVERGIRGIPDARSRLALVFIVREVMQPIPHDRTADSGAELIDDEPRQGLFGLEVAFVHPHAVHGVLSEVVASG